MFDAGKLLEKDKYTIYGIDASYFSMKLLAALRWSPLEFEYVYKSMDIKEEAEKRSGTQQIPVSFSSSQLLLCFSQLPSTK